MSDLQRLQDKLDKLVANDESNGANGREIRAGNDGDLVLAVLHELDETVLSRALTFENEQGLYLEFAVASRRLQSLSAGSQEIAPGAFDALFGESLSESRSDLIDHLGALLDAFVSNSGKLTVRSQRPDDLPSPSSVGCPPQALALAWGKKLYQLTKADLANQIEGFVASVSDISTAWVTFSRDGLVQQLGTEQHLGALLDLASNDFADLEESVIASLDEPVRIGCVVLAAPNDNHSSIAYVFCDTQKGLILFPSSDLAVLNALWDRALNS